MKYIIEMPEGWKPGDGLFLHEMEAALLTTTPVKEQGEERLREELIHLLDGGRKSFLRNEIVEILTNEKI